MLNYRPAIFGIFMLLFLCIVYNFIVDITDDYIFLILLAVIYIIWLVYCSYYCFITVAKYYSIGSKYSENAVSFLNGLFAGPFGILIIYNMNKAYKGYTSYIAGAIYGLFAIGNIINLLQVI